MMKTKMKIETQVRDAVEAMLDAGQYPVALRFPPELWAYYVEAYEWEADGAYTMVTGRRPGSLYTGIVTARADASAKVVEADAGEPWTMAGESEMMSVLRNATPVELAKLPWFANEAVAMDFAQARQGRGLRSFDDLRAVGMAKPEIDRVRAGTAERPLKRPAVPSDIDLVPRGRR